MNPPGPGLLSLVPFVSVDHMMRIVWDIGVERMIVELAAYIEEDFRRWELFDKTPRIAAHSAEGVIELMPTSDGATYGFKYVNGHPKNAAAGRQTVTAFGVLSHVDSGYPMLISEMTILTALRTAATSALAAQGARAAGRADDGDHRQRRAVRVPGARLQGAVRRRGGAALRHRSGGDAKGGGEPRRIGPRRRLLPFERGGDPRGRDRHHLHRRQAQRDHPDRQHDRRRRPPQRDRRRLPGQDGAAPRHPAALGHLRRIRAADPDRGRDPAARPRPSGDRALAGPDRTGARAAGRPVRSPCSTASASPSRTSPPCATSATSSNAAGISSTSTCSPTPTIRATFTACCCGTGPQAHDHRGPPMALTGQDLRALADWRRALHRSPELSGHEEATAREVRRFLGPTRPDRSSRTSAVMASRSSTTAPGRVRRSSSAPNSTPCRSRRSRPSPIVRRARGEAHLCGHDGHMAILAGVAQGLAAERPRRGRAVLLFQPAEEDGSGAEAVLADPKFAADRAGLLRSPCTTCRACRSATRR